MNKTLKKGFMVSVLSLSLVLSLASISLAMEGMASNMPGMESNSPSGEGHSGTEGATGVNWPVVGGFSAINLLVIGTAGVLKFIKRSKLEMLD
ncbi:hypothetical protein [Desulfitobacterium metallireducens]|uniref:Uncharacterized protein n=1 Tax=Desulfitobacterium metallireducens DSM 15288 TaxID=871968 RepID=W0EGR9_9FIRM|nr:hypothetical protein [Desulfitobacterium metallireducens]AHF08399.1 hypothetical protein DESME_01910 [Desulfitobacterium metallireducens DSM 15288]